MTKEGERIILIDERGRGYFVKAERRQLHTDFGVIELSDAIGKEPGAKLKSHVGREFILLKPRIRELPRLPQPMIPTFIPSPIHIVQWY